MNNALRVWGSAVALAAVPAAVVFGAERPGLNIGLTLGLLVLVSWTLEARHQSWNWRAVPVADVLVLVLASVSAVSGNPVVLALSVLTLGWTCALALLHRAGWRGVALRAWRVVLAPFGALALVALGTRAAAVEALIQMRGGRYLPVLRGVLWAVPLVLVFFLLLAEADATFESWRTQLLTALQDLSFLPRLMFWVVVSVVLAGVLMQIAGGTAPQRVPAADHVAAGTRTATERLIILCSVVVLFALFLLLQLGALFANPGAIAGSGVTYAQAVHRGFLQLIVVVTVSAALLLVLDSRALRGVAEARVRAVSAVLLGQCLLLLLSAWQRLLAYAEAYGWSTLRVCVHLCIVGIALALLVLLREQMTGLVLRRAVQRISAAGITVLLVLCFWNIPAWVVDANLERAGRGHEVDWHYLLDQLPLDAVPALERQLARLEDTQRAALRCRVLRQPELTWLLEKPDRWFEWNWRRSQALAAARRMTREAGGSCAAVTDGG